MDDKLVIIKKEGKKALEVSERLYRVYYKGLGYKLADADDAEPVDDNEQVPDGDEGDQEPALDELTKAEIISKLKEGGVEHNPRDTKEVLLKLLEGE